MIETLKRHILWITAFHPPVLADQCYVKTISRSNSKKLFKDETLYIIQVALLWLSIK